MNKIREYYNLIEHDNVFSPFLVTVNRLKRQNINCKPMLKCCFIFHEASFFFAAFSHYGNFRVSYTIRPHTESHANAFRCSWVNCFLGMQKSTETRKRSWKESFNGIAHSFETF